MLSNRNNARLKDEDVRRFLEADMMLEGLIRSVYERTENDPIPRQGVYMHVAAVAVNVNIHYAKEVRKTKLKMRRTTEEVVLLTNRFIPALKEAASEVHDLWRDVEDLDKSIEEIDRLVDEYEVRAAKSDSALTRLREAMVDLIDLVEITRDQPLSVQIVSADADIEHYQDHS